jgi:stage V sporulation protein D (sporulation-specific penicillin-binding protein)
MNLSLLSSSRSRTLVWIMLITGAIFTIRLFYLQVIQHTYYENEALKEHTSKFMLPAQRGQIYARDGSDGSITPLVLNEASYTVYADPRYVTDESHTADVVRRIAGGNLVDDFESGLKNKDLQYTILAHKISQKQADLLLAEKLPGVGLQEQDRRVYPEGPLAAQVLGYVNNDGHGQYGIEQALDGDLSGKPGLLKAVTDVRGIPLSVGDNNIQEPAQDGKNLVLTIDRNVQSYVEQALKDGLEKVHAKHGSAIVMDPKTGGVLAMANLPTFDPNKYFEQSDYSAFQNAVVSSPYEAGSVVKTFTMAAGLNEGVVKPDSTFNNTGSIKVGDATIRNVLQNVNGTRNMMEVFQYSLNTGVVHVLQQLGGGSLNGQGRDKLYSYFTDNYLFGKKTGIEQSGELTGEVIAPDVAEGNDVRYANMTFGQGMDNTMIQITSAFAAMVNGGTYYKPHVVDGSVNADGDEARKASQVVKSDVIRPEISRELNDMMHEARKRSIPGQDKAGYYVAGKTGTAQVIDPKTGKYSDDNAVGSYLGFGGNSNTDPRYVIMVRVTDAKVGSAVYAGGEAAAPIFANISNWLLDYLHVQPK